jgi:hypothetical protein
MENLKEVLTENFYTYLNYDQVGNTKWQSPFSDNSDYHSKVRRDSERMAEIAVHKLKRIKNGE